VRFYLTASFFVGVKMSSKLGLPIHLFDRRTSQTPFINHIVAFANAVRAKIIGDAGA
jgi:hypothetical protein